MTSEQQQWLLAIEQERLALVSENARLRRQLALTTWALTAVLFGACGIVLWTLG